MRATSSRIVALSGVWILLVGSLSTIAVADGFFVVANDTTGNARVQVDGQTLELNPNGGIARLNLPTGAQSLSMQITGTPHQGQANLPLGGVQGFAAYVFQITQNGFVNVFGGQAATVVPIR